jgi:hypothetical protein
MADPTDELTLTEVIQALRSDGFPNDFSVAPGGLVSCAQCGHSHDAAGLAVEATGRVEGVSNPDDEAAAFGLLCAECGTRGVLVVAYGPSASADEATVVTTLG